MVSLALQQLGVPVVTVVIMFDTIQHMAHQVWTAFEDSEGKYGGDEIDDGYSEFPQGFNQCNRIGPQGWTILSSVLFKALKSKGYRMSLIQAITRETYKLATWMIAILLSLRTLQRRCLCSCKNQCHSGSNWFRLQVDTSRQIRER